MFTGTHERSLDEKGRLVVPPLFRAKLADGAYATVSSERPCIQIYSESEMLKAAARIDEAVRNGETSADDLRRWSARLTELRLDAQGRVALPANLRTEVGLEQQVVLIGVLHRAEVWDADAWATVQSQPGDSDIGRFL